MADNIVARQASVPQTAIFKEAAKAAQKVAAYARNHAHEDQRTSLMTQTDSYRKKILEHPGWKFMRWPCRTYLFGADKVDIKVCHQYREYSDRSPQSEGTGVGVYFEEQNKCALDKKGGTSPRMCPGHAQAFCRRQGVHALRSGGGTLAIIAENGTLFYK